MIVTCDDLSDPANGVVDQPSNSVGTVAIYDCNEGYLLVGSDTRTCQESGEWSGEEPGCECKYSVLNKMYSGSANCMSCIEPIKLIKIL